MAGRGWIGSDTPEVRGDKFPWGAYGWAVVAVVACTGVDYVLLGRIDEANLILIYLLGVLAVALRGDRTAALLTAVGAVSAFDFFFVEPMLTFRVSDTQYLLTFVIMGLVSVVISTLVTQLAARMVEANRREKRAHALYELSRALLLAREPKAVLGEGAQVLSRELGVPVGGWLIAPDGSLLGTHAAFELTPELASSLRLVIEQAGQGDGFPAMARHAEYGFVPVATPARVYGVLGVGIQGTAPTFLGEVRAVLETGANQIALALDQVKAREDADLARAQAETERLRSVLLSSVSHDLRTPLTGIVGAAEALVTGVEVLDVDTRRDLAISIEEEAERLNRLVTNLLQATQLDSGAAELHRDWTTIEDIVGPALARTTRLLGDRRVEVDLPFDLPLVFVDAVMLEQVFINVLENVSKYTPSQATVRIRARASADLMTLEVADDGPGLPPGQEGGLFERFQRGAAGGVAGAGLGLAIVRGIIEAHGGSVSAANRPEGGASFQFTLPVKAPTTAIAPVLK